MPNDEHLIEAPLGGETVYDGHFLRVQRDRVRLPDGAEASRECWRRSKFDPPCRLNFDPGLGTGIR
jgi:hypothetical protein